MDAARDAAKAAGQIVSGGPHRTRPPHAAPSLEDALGALWDEVRGLVHDQLLLASLESRHALAALNRTLVLAVSCAALVVGAWSAAMAGVVIWIVDSGQSLTAALFVVVGLTGVLAAGSFLLARRSLREVSFPATLRRLANAPLPDSDE